MDDGISKKWPVQDSYFSGNLQIQYCYQGASLEKKEGHLRWGVLIVVLVVKMLQVYLFHLVSVGVRSDSFSSHASDNIDVTTVVLQPLLGAATW